MPTKLWVSCLLLCLNLAVFAQNNQAWRPSMEKGEVFLSFRGASFAQEDYLQGGGIDGIRTTWGLKMGIGYSFAPNWVLWGGLDYEHSSARPLDRNGPTIIEHIPRLYLRRYLTSWKVLKRPLSPYLSGGFSALLYKYNPILRPTEEFPLGQRYYANLIAGINWRIFPRWSIEGEVGTRYLLANHNLVDFYNPWEMTVNYSLNFHFRK